MSENVDNISHEGIVELQKKFSEIKHGINNALAVMMALSEMSQRHPDYSEKLASTVLTKAPLIVSRLGEFTQALNEKAPPVAATQALNEYVPRGWRFTAGPSQKIEKQMTIINRLGLDAIPAAMFVRIACRYRSGVWVENEGQQINGKSIMGLMMLAAGQGSKLTIRCEGPDADKVMQELEELIKNRFNEDCRESESQRREQGPTSLQKKFSQIKYAITNALAEMMALSQMLQRHPHLSERLASTVLTKAPQIVSGLQEFAQALNEKAGLKPEAVPPNRESRITLASLLSAEQIIPEMKATERWSAIVELVDLLVSLGKIKTGDRESILASVKQREETMSTGIGRGIALPHAYSDRIEQVVAAFGRSSEGIEFDALDNAPVKFVVLFIGPENQIQNHLRTLASIAKFLNERSVRERLAAVKSADEIFAICDSRVGQREL